ncbi:MAG: hypothetical protein ABFS39_04105 [Pseudomonadota bacterium]
MPLSQAVEDYYLMAVESDKPLSAVDYRPSEEIESDIEIWLYAVIARYNNMDENERILFDLKFRETLDPVFSGRYLVHDVYVRFRLSDDAAMRAKG